VIDESLPGEEKSHFLSQHAKWNSLAHNDKICHCHPYTYRLSLHETLALRPVPCFVLDQFKVC